MSATVVNNGAETVNAAGTETQNPLVELYAGYTPEMLATLPPETRREVEAARNAANPAPAPVPGQEPGTGTETPAQAVIVPETDQKAPEVAPADPAAPAETTEQPAEVNWEKLLALHQARYQTLQGKYNAEVPELNRQLQQLREENARLKAQAGGNGQPAAGSENAGAAAGNPAIAERIAKLEAGGFDHEAAVALVEVMGGAAPAADSRLDQVAQNVDLLRQRDEEERRNRINAALDAELGKRGLSIALLEQQGGAVDEFMNQFTRLDPVTQQRVSAAQDYSEASSRGDVVRMAEILKVISDQMRAEQVFYAPPHSAAAAPQQTVVPAAPAAVPPVRRGAPALPRSVNGAAPALPPAQRDQATILAELNAVNRKFNTGVGDPAALLRTIDKLNKELASAPATGGGGR